MHCHAPKVQPVAGVGPSSCHARVLMLMLDTRQWWEELTWPGMNGQLPIANSDSLGLMVLGALVDAWCVDEMEIFADAASIPIKLKVVRGMHFNIWIFCFTSSSLSKIQLGGSAILCASSRSAVVMRSTQIRLSCHTTNGSWLASPFRRQGLLADQGYVSRCHCDFRKVELISEISDIRWYQHISRCVTWRIVTSELIRTCIRTCQKWHRVTFAAEGLIEIRTLRRDSRFVTLLL